MKRIIIPGLLAVLFSSCMQESLEPVGQGSYEGNTQTEASLELSVAVDSLESKSVITSSTLPAGAQVGVHLVDETSTGFYQGHDYSNVLYTMNSGKLTTDETVMLTPTSGTVYAYYPYVEDADITSLPVSALTQTDYMYATSHSGLTFSNYSASLVMNHAMAVASFRIVKGNYSGACKVSSVAVKGSNLYTSATYNGKNGSFSSHASSNKLISSSEGSFTLNTTGTVRNVILIPAPYGTTVTVNINLDGYDRTVAIPSFHPVAGKRYAYTLTVNEEEIIVSDVNVNSWGNANSEYSVYITGDTKDIAINQQVNEDGSILIKAAALHFAEVMNDVTISGTADVTTYDDVIQGDFTVKSFLLSSIESDIYMKFNGLTNTKDLDCIYRFESGQSFSFGLNLLNSNYQHVGINGVKVTSDNYSSLLKSNEDLHVEIWYQDGYAPSSVTSVFGGSNDYFSSTNCGLKYIQFGKSVTTVGGFSNKDISYLEMEFLARNLTVQDDAFMGATLGDFCFSGDKYISASVSIGQRAFQNAKLGDLRLIRPDSNLTITINQSAFYQATISNVHLVGSIIKLQTSCFYQTEINGFFHISAKTSVTFGSQCCQGLSADTIALRGKASWDLRCFYSCTASKLYFDCSGNTTNGSPICVFDLAGSEPCSVFIGSNVDVIPYGFCCNSVIDVLCFKEGVKSIGSYAFDGCSSSHGLSVVLPASLESIGLYAFFPDIDVLGFSTLSPPSASGYICSISGYFPLIYIPPGADEAAYRSFLQKGWAGYSYSVNLNFNILIAPAWEFPEFKLF